MKRKVCHMTSVHQWSDTRIFYKECSALAVEGYDVFLVAPVDGSFTERNVQVIGVGKNQGSRLKRATVVAYRVMRNALRTKSDIYHFHDPELIWTGLILRMRGKKVIFDIHENIVEQIKVKRWLKFRGLFSALYRGVDWLSSKVFRLVLAEESYLKTYSKLTSNATVVMNFPDCEALSTFRNEKRGAELTGVFYVGGISVDRGIDVTIAALAELKRMNVACHFHCVGAVSPELMNYLETQTEYNSVKSMITFYGSMNVMEAYRISGQCVAGLSVLKPIGNYVESYSTKVFEYMSVGLPVITSDFELYRNVVERHQCGYCINPQDPHALASALKEILTNRDAGNEMGARGVRAALSEYSWTSEAKKLISLYKSL